MANTRKTDDAGRKDPEKTVDLPPYGPRNPDPLTDAPGSHPIETGVGAVVGGALSGLAVGTLTAGPLGAVAGAIAGGAVAGGYAGKGVGELLDPTTEDNWIRDYLARRRAEPDYDAATDPAATDAYRFGLRAEARFHGRSFAESEAALRAEWEALHPNRGWSDARRPAQDGFDRARDMRGVPAGR
ncbi:MAG: hypothetical protein C0501_11660 [Isosphaera sp.]|nr:hypothetical protein [Isosphaera sp.]